MVDAAGTAVAVTAANQINLASTGLRLGRPVAKPTAKCSNCGGLSHTGLARKAEQRIYPGPEARRSSPSWGSDPDHPTSRTRETTCFFSFNASLPAGSEDTADGFAALFRALYLALDERQISYPQGTLQLLIRRDRAEDSGEAAELGISSDGEGSVALRPIGMIRGCGLARCRARAGGCPPVQGWPLLILRGAASGVYAAMIWVTALEQRYGPLDGQCRVESR